MQSRPFVTTTPTFLHEVQAFTLALRSETPAVSTQPPNPRLSMLHVAAQDPHPHPHRRCPQTQASLTTRSPTDRSSPQLSYRKTAFKPYIRFSDREHDMLRTGVLYFGTGHWKNILNYFPFHPKRTAVDLKDKWRNILRKQERQKIAAATTVDCYQHVALHQMHSSPETVLIHPRISDQDSTPPSTSAHRTVFSRGAHLPELVLGTSNQTANDVVRLSPYSDCTDQGQDPSDRVAFEVPGVVPAAADSNHPSLFTLPPQPSEAHRRHILDVTQEETIVQDLELPERVGAPTFDTKSQNLWMYARIPLSPASDNTQQIPAENRMNLSFILS